MARQTIANLDRSLALAVSGLACWSCCCCIAASENIGRLTVTFWLRVLAAIAWILVDGAVRFQPEVAFEMPQAQDWSGTRLC